MSRNRRAVPVAAALPLVTLTLASTAAYAGATAGASPAAELVRGGVVDTAIGEQLIGADESDRVARKLNPASVGLGDRMPARDITVTSGIGLFDIPNTALAAYHLASATVEQVRPSCAVPWSLLAAIGRVESDHGRYDGAVLGVDGVSDPVIRGVALDGTGPVARVEDTDGGDLDGDRRWDRAVGPMQFLPSTWSLVAVDADGDGRRSADDLDDAALGAAVYLCSTSESTGGEAGMRQAVHAYNPSSAYVAAVLALEEQYRASILGDLSPTSVVPVGVAPPTATPDVQTDGRGEDRDRSPGGRRDGSSGRDGSDGSGGGGGPDDSDGGSGSSGPGGNSGPGGGTGSGPGGDSGPGGSPSASPTPTPSPTAPASPTPTPTCPDPVTAAEPVDAATEDVTGTLALCDTTWLLLDAQRDGVALGDLVLDPGSEEWLAEMAAADLDADGATESNADELSGLIGTEVTLGVAAGTDPAYLRTVNALTYRDI